MRKEHVSIGVVIFSCLVFLGAGCVSNSAVNSPDYYYNQGTKLMKRGEYVKSISKFTKTIEMKKSPRDAYHNRGIAYEKIGDLRKALNDFDSAIKIDDQYHKAFASRAMTYVRMRKYRKARKDARKALEIKPGYSSAYYVLGAIEKRKGNKNKAIEYLSKSINNEPKRYEPYFIRGQLYFDEGLYSQSIQDLDRAQSLTNEEFAAFIAYHKSKTLAGLGKVQRAEEQYLKSLEYFQRNGRKPTEFEKGYMWYRLGHYKKALEHLDNVESDDPYYRDAENTEVLALLVQDKYKRVKKELKTSSTISNASRQAILAQINRDRDRLKKALKLINKSIEVQKDFENYHEKAMILFDLGRNERGLQTLRESLNYTFKDVWPIPVRSTKYEVRERIKSINAESEISNR